MLWFKRLLPVISMIWDIVFSEGCYFFNLNDLHNLDERDFPRLQRLWPRRPWQKSLTTPGELSGEAIEIASSKFSKSWRSCHILPFWNKDFCQVNSSFRNFHFYPILGSGKIASSKLSSSEGALSKLLKQTSKKGCFFLCFTGLFTVSALIPTQSAKGLLLREKAQVHILQLRPSRKYGRKGWVSRG